MERLTFLRLAKQVLEEEKKPLSVDDIWEIAKTKGYDKLLVTEGKTPWATLGAHLYTNVRDKKDSIFVGIGARPKRFFLQELMNGVEIEKLEQKEEPELISKKKYGYLEKDLHPFLAYFAKQYLKSYTKTIQHTHSGKKNFGEWVHPDVVGCYFPVEDWEPEVIEFGLSVGNVAVKLFSFEIKRELTFGNLREAFFQSVSNSSWAHEGYLVASNISRDDDFLTELKRLSTSFGIGIIYLNIEEPDSSEILFPAKTRENLDWDAINKLCISPDFQKFLKRIKTDILSKEIWEDKYDKVLDAETLLKIIKKQLNCPQ